MNPVSHGGFTQISPTKPKLARYYVGCVEAAAAADALNTAMATDRSCEVPFIDPLVVDGTYILAVGDVLENINIMRYILRVEQ